LSVRIISINASLDRVREENVYTRAALLAKQLTRSLADSVKSLITKNDEIKVEQVQLWDKETEAQAYVDSYNYVLDELAQDLSEAKVKELRQKNSSWRDREARESKEYQLYFSQPLSSLIRMAPESQAKEMKSWIILLEKEASPELQELLPRLKTAIAETEVAVKNRDDAAKETAIHRVRVIEQFINDVNTFRTKLYATLLILTQDNHLNKSWTDIFFRPAPQGQSIDDSIPGLHKALLIQFKTKGFQLTDDQLKKSVGVKDPKNLEQLIASACTATSVDEVLAGVN
jgi:hypothetical protein